MEEQLALDRELMEQRSQRLVPGPDAGNRRHRRPVPSGQGGGKPALQRLPLFAGGGGNPGVVRAAGRIPGADRGEHGRPYRRGGPARLFEAFYRAEGSRNRSTGGSGLGLYLVRMILDRHGAACTIENTQEGVKAACWFFRAPVVDFRPNVWYDEQNTPELPKGKGTYGTNHFNPRIRA